MEKIEIKSVEEKIIPFEPPLTGVSETTGRRVLINGYLPAYPPQFRYHYADGAAEIMTTGEDIIIDDEQLFAPALKPLKPPQKKPRVFSETFKKKIRWRLLSETAKIKREHDSAIKKFREETRNSSQPKGGNHPADTNDDANATALLHKKTENCDKRLWKIGLALMRLEYNLYGLCKICGGEIPLARLNEIPYADSHVSCKGVGHRGHRSKPPRTYLAPRAAH